MTGRVARSEQEGELWKAKGVARILEKGGQIC